MSTKPHICHILPALPFGGAERFVVDLINSTHKDFTYSIILFRDEKPFAAQISSNIDIHVVTKRGKFDLGFVSRIAATLGSIKPDLVHTHLWGADVWGAKAAKKAGIPVVRTEHNTNIGESWLHHSIKRAKSRIPMAFTAPSQAVSKYMQRTYRVGGSDVTVIQYGIALDQFVSLPEPDWNEPLRLLMLGRFDRQKGYDIALQALAKTSRKDWRLDCVGSGSEEQSLKSLVASLGLTNNVTFHLPTDDVASLYASHHALLLPSRWEGLGIVNMEASASGRPVIASNVGGIPEVVTDGETGVLVPPEDVDALTQALEHAFAHPAELQKMGRAGRARAKKEFGVDTMATAYTQWYSSLLSTL